MLTSRVAKMPVELPNTVTATITDELITVKGPKGTLSKKIAKFVCVKEVEKALVVSLANPNGENAVAYAGTMRAHINNMVKGVSEGFTVKLELVGVGYRAAVQGNNLNLTLGFSHPVSFTIPDGIKIDTPTQTEIVLTGPDREKVTQLAANIRRKRLPEPYKGKGIKYAGEIIILKETKKK